MKSTNKIKELARKTLQIEADAVSGLKKYINDDFVKTVLLIYETKARVVVTGIVDR